MAANLAREMATVGLPWTARLAGAAAAQRMVFVDAPVSGSEGPARAGQLTVLASGPDWLADLAESLTFRTPARPEPGRYRHSRQLRHSLTNPSTEVPTAMSTATIAAATRAVRARRLPGSGPK
jgi:hypothetical protein